jgi:hypothetical protein
MDSDMLYGGGRSRWIEEAISYFELTPKALFMAPLAGPPTWDDLHSDTQRNGAPAVVNIHHSVSTRIFLFNRKRFELARLKFPLERPNRFSQAKAIILGNSPVVLEAETVLSHGMVRAGYFRADFLGGHPGMWTLHPQYRSAEFYRKLPELIARVEAGDIPAGQRGNYDIVDELIDWSDVRGRYRRVPRLMRQLRHAGRHWVSLARRKTSLAFSKPTDQHDDAI